MSRPMISSTIVGVSDKSSLASGVDVPGLMSDTNLHDKHKLRGSTKTLFYYLLWQNNNCRLTSTSPLNFMQLKVHGI